MHRNSLVLIVAAIAMFGACKSKTTQETQETKDKAPGSATSEPVGSGAAAAPPKIDAPTVDLVAFDKSCKEATDCVLVKRASCDPCACAVDAIASKEMAKFDEAAAKLVCPPPDLDRQMACGGCDRNTATCTNGQCVIGAPAAATP